MVSFLLNMPSGFPGTISRQEHATVEGQPINTTTPPLSYGTMVVMDAATGTIRQATTADLLANFYGLLVRPWPTQGFGNPLGSLSDPVGPTAPTVIGTADVMRRGYMLVRIGGATAAVKGTPANIWVGATGGGQVQGNITAVAPGANTCIAVPGLMFMSTADATTVSPGMVEVAYNI